MRDTEIETVLQRVYGQQPSTYENYKHRLHFLRDKVFPGKSMYAIMADPDGSYAVLRKRYPNINTRKNMMTVILALFKNSEKLQQHLHREAEKWREYHGHMDSYQEAKYKKHLPSEKQLAKYTPFEEMEEKYGQLRLHGDPHATKGDSMRFLLLSIIVTTPPKRCDYGSMQVYYEEDPNIQGENYLVLHRSTKSRPRPSYMVFQRYKTSKRYNRIDQVLPSKTTRDIKDSLRRYPREYLFENKYDTPFETNNAFGKFVRRTFNHYFGRDTGMTMLRHIFVTEKVSFDEMDDDELEDIAKQMMHTRGLQHKYKWKRGAVCKKLSALQQQLSCDEAASDRSS